MGEIKMTKRAETITKYMERLSILENTNLEKYEEVYKEFRDYLKKIEQ